MTSKMPAKKKRREDDDSRGFPSTLSIAIPSSVIENAQTAELATSLSGQIARTAAIFNIDEIVIIDETFAGNGKLGKGAAFLARILQYQETPQYLRKALIPMHADLKLAGLLPPLDAPHHMRASEWCAYREGVVTKSDINQGSLVNVGLDKAAFLEEGVKVGVRITVYLGQKATIQTEMSSDECYKASLAGLSDPREKLGTYWGYQTRIASSLRDLTTKCPFEGGYDLKIGTSERGTVASASELVLPDYKHLLLIFGGPLGLEDLFSKAGEADYTAPQETFDMYINTCPEQGSRTIRTEEAILISLTHMQPALSRLNLHR